MFINSKKRFEIREGNQRLVIPYNFIGNIPDWAARHWLVQAAIQDGSIVLKALYHVPEGLGRVEILRNNVHRRYLDSKGIVQLADYGQDIKGIQIPVINQARACPEIHRWFYVF